MTCQLDSPLKHKHHIMPRYRGGSDDPSNLVEVSVVQHAMWHFCNYQLWGAPEDRLAWRALAGSIGKEEIAIEKQKIGSAKGGAKVKQLIETDEEYRAKWSEKVKKSHENPEYKKKNADHLRSIQHIGVEAARKPESRAKLSKTLRRIGHQKGEKNSQYGTRWIHNLELRVSSRVKKDYPLPEGWKEGRVINFDKKLNPILKPVREKTSLGVPISKPVKQKMRLGVPRDWYHEVYGVVLNKTSSELCDMYKNQNLNKGALSQVALGRSKSHKGWKIVGEKGESKRKGKKPRDWIHPVHGEVRNTSAKELVEMFPQDKLDINSLYRVANKKAKFHRKWKLLEDN